MKPYHYSNIYYIKQNSNMGRYYGGTISGKFWFAIQSSADVENLCDIKYKQMYYWRNCGCEFTEDELNTINKQNEPFCNKCFESYNAHRTAVIEDEHATGDDSDNESDDVEELYDETQSIYYNIIGNIHKEAIENSVNKLQKQIDLSTFSYSISSDTYEIKCEVNEEIKCEATLALIARYIFGKQILEALKHEDVCYLECEC